MREMKGSGIEWIGEIPEGWKVSKIKNLARVYTGNSINDDQKELYKDNRDAIPYISTKDIDSVLQTINYDNGMYIKRQDMSFRRVPTQSILLCIEGGSAGKKIAFTNREVCFVNKLCCIHSTDNSNKLYFPGVFITTQ